MAPGSDFRSRSDLESSGIGVHSTKVQRNPELIGSAMLSRTNRYAVMKSHSVRIVGSRIANPRRKKCLNVRLAVPWSLPAISYLVRRRQTTIVLINRFMVVQDISGKLKRQLTLGLPL